MLLNAGADIKARTKQGLPPLHIAVWANENPAVITALLNAGADPRLRDEEGKTAWDHAPKNEAFRLAVLSESATLLAKRDWTHLDGMALSSTHPAVIDALLLRAGADPKARDQGHRRL